MATLIPRLVVIAIISSGLLFCQSAGPPQTVLISGVAKDSKGGTVAGVKVVFEGKGKSWETSTDDQGAYSIELPVGIYKARAESNWFSPARRPAFRVQPGVPVKLDFLLEAYSIVTFASIANGKYKEREERLAPFKEETISLKEVPFELLVRFGQRTRGRPRGTILYKRRSTEDAEFLPVLVMYDVLTLKANKVKLDLHHRRLTAEGNVLVYDNGNIDFGASALVEFKSGRPYVTLRH